MTKEFVTSIAKIIRTNFVGGTARYTRNDIATRFAQALGEDYPRLRHGEVMEEFLAEAGHSVFAPVEDEGQWKKEEVAR